MPQVELCQDRSGRHTWSPVTILHIRYGNVFLHLASTNNPIRSLGNMDQYRGHGAIEFVHGLIRNYGQLVVKLHFLFNVSELWLVPSKLNGIQTATGVIHIRPQSPPFHPHQGRSSMGRVAGVHRVSVPGYLALEPQLHGLPA